MKRNSRTKRQRPLPGSPRLAEAGPREAKTTDELRALSRTELVGIVLQLQAAQPPASQNPSEAAESQEPSPVSELASPAAAAPARSTALVIESSVRSGQTIEFPNGDVTVIGSVGSGAEIIAGGSIHVYGTLRGRAIAGTSGDQTARIFCQDLDAELLSIDGKYRVAENFDPKLRGRPVQARLEGMRMTLVPLDFAPAAASEPAPVERASTDRIRRATDRMRQLISIGVPRDLRMAEGASS